MALLWALWAFIAALLVVRALLRRWPRAAAWLGAVLPLPCTHTDADGESMMYRDRRDIEGRSVPHWVCADCGTAIPIVARDLADVDAIAKIRPAHESMHAKPGKPAAPAAQVLRGRGFAQQSVATLCFLGRLRVIWAAVCQPNSAHDFGGGVC